MSKSPEILELKVFLNSKYKRIIYIFWVTADLTHYPSEML